jgi:hypothetical protein
MESAAKLDTEILEAVLQAADSGSPPSLAELLARFPERAAAARAVLEAVQGYWTELRVWRDEARPRARGREVMAAGAVLGDFRIEGVLGIGAMGVVYRARQLSLGDRVVALKVLPRGLVERDPRFAERFRREARLAAGLHHPHVAEVFGFGPDDGDLYFAMRLVEGRTLHEVLAERAARRRAGDAGDPATPQHLRRTVRLVRALADALAAIHALGLVHRDVKPANVLLERAAEDQPHALDARPILVDFGLLRPVEGSTLTRSGTVLGTPAYAAPEVQLGREVDARADVFSLGAVLHDLLSLTAPGERPPASAGLPPIRALNRAVDERLAAVLRMATEEKPGLRYADGAALRDELDAWLQHRPIRALPGSALGRARLWARRHPVAAVKATAPVGVLALLLGVAGAWAWLTTSRIADNARDAAALEAAGDLRRAAAAHRLVHDDRELALHLPWLADEVARAQAYWGEGGALSELRAGLEVETENSFAVAHDRIHEFVFDPELREHRELALRFLLREVRHGETAWRKGLALESFADILLFDQRGQPWLAELRPHLEELVGSHARDDVDLRALRAAASALGGMLDPAAFRMLMPLIGHGDPETVRVAVMAAERIWDWLHRGGAEPEAELGEDALDAWARAVWRLREPRFERRLPPSMPPGPLDEGAIFALTRIAFDRARADPKAAREGAELPADLARILTALENSFRRRLASADRFRTTPIVFEPSGNAWFDTRLLDLQRPSLYREVTGGDYIYEYERQVWIRRREAEPTLLAATGPAGAGSRADPRASAVLGFRVARSGSPSLTGLPGTVAAWRGAALDAEGDGNPNEWSFLKFDQPGQSALELRTPIPAGVTGARVRLWYTRAARWPLPGAGRCRVRVAVQDGLIDARRNAPTDRVREWRLDVEGSHLAGSEDLLVRVELVDANTTLRIDRLQIDWIP